LAQGFRLKLHWRWLHLNKRQCHPCMTTPLQAIYEHVILGLILLQPPLCSQDGVTSSLLS